MKNIYDLIESRISQNGVEYYNIEEQKENKEKHIPTEPVLVSSGRTSSSTTTQVESLDSKPRGEGEPLDSGATEKEAAPLGPHNVKRALVQLFNNTQGSRKLKVRLNLDDDTSAEFIAPLQPKSNLTNFLRYTADDKETARSTFTTIRSHCKETYGTTPQQGKFHLNTVQWSEKRGTIQVEPRCYGAASYAPEEKCYYAIIQLYDLILADIQLDDGYLTDKQKKQGVRGQYLWINPLYDTRQRPKTFAQRRREQGKL
jgi:hypothetical protein